MKQSMSNDLPSCDHIVVEDEYIDMFYGISSPPRSIEFEFPMSAERETSPSPADELFYKGKLLPLHLPPRFQMVQKLILSSNSDEKEPETATTTSEELSQEECVVVQSQSKRSWFKKLKASKAYFKSLFANKSRCSSKLNSAPEAKVSKYPSLIEREKLLEEECMYRKSFSGAINCHLIPRSSAEVSSCSSSSSSSSSFSRVDSNRFHGSRMLKRSSSMNSEMESSIQGAIDYCKKSHAELCSPLASRIVATCNNQESPGICRG